MNWMICTPWFGRHKDNNNEQSTGFPPSPPLCLSLPASLESDCKQRIGPGLANRDLSKYSLHVLWVWTDMDVNFNLTGNQLRGGDSSLKPVFFPIPTHIYLFFLTFLSLFQIGLLLPCYESTSPWGHIGVVIFLMYWLNHAGCHSTI